MSLRNSEAGRSRKSVHYGQINFLRKIGLNWSDISKTLKLSRSTLYRNKRSLNINEKVISDEELNFVLRSAISETPNAGEIYVMGSLRGRNIRVTRSRVIDQLKMIDPVGRELRRSRTLQRRVYNVKGSNYLWYNYLLE